MWYRTFFQTARRFFYSRFADMFAFSVLPNREPQFTLLKAIVFTSLFSFFRAVRQFEAGMDSRPEQKKTILHTTPDFESDVKYSLLLLSVSFFG